MRTACRWITSYLAALMLAAVASTAGCDCGRAEGAESRADRVSSALKGTDDARGRKVKVALALAGEGGGPVTAVAKKDSCGCKDGCKCNPCRCAKPKAIRWEASYAKGWEQARRDGKPVLCLVTAGDPPAAFADPSVVAAASGYVCVRVDAEKNQLFTTSLGVRRFPTVLLADPHGNVNQRIEGDLAAADLAGKLDPKRAGK